MSKTSKTACCGTCLWYNGDMNDKEAFCDDKEDFVSVNHFCYRYSNADYFEGEDKDGR